MSALVAKLQLARSFQTCLENLSSQGVGDGGTSWALLTALYLVYAAAAAAAVSASLCSLRSRGAAAFRFRGKRTDNWYHILWISQKSLKNGVSATPNPACIALQ